MRGRADRRRITIGAILMAGLVSGAWALGYEPPRTEPAPVDVLLDEAQPAALEEVAEAVDAAMTTSVRMASGAVAGTADALSGRKSWDMPVTYNDRVGYWIDFLTGPNAERTRLWLERAGRYAPMIRGKLAERAMPTDLLYLAMIESGLSPRAYSRAHASGMWQFISETGRRYGLDVTPYVDERRDPVEATDAALDYLGELYDRFGSWYLAAAAYNSGENRVDRILREQARGARGDDALFWRIAGHLPRETRDYVPLMLAAGHIGKDPAKYGFEGLEHQEALSYETVRVRGATRLATVARAVEVEPDVIQDLNPHLVRGITPPGREWEVRIPSGKRLAFVLNYEEAARSEAASVVDHRVRRGETFSHIARQYGVSLNQLRSANPGLNPRRLLPGQDVTVPVAERGAAPGAEQAATRWRTYRVRSGDTLWGIARRHDVSVGQLQHWNGIGRGGRILPGQTLRIRA